MSATSTDRLISILAVALLAIAAAGCSSDDSSSDGTTAVTAAAGGSTSGSGSGSTVSGGSAVDSGDLRQSVITALTTDVMVPAYERMSIDSAAMLAAVQAVCATPTDVASLDAARQSWSTARTSWLVTRAFRFGPATTLRTMSTIDFPIDTTKIDKLIAATEPLTAESLGALGADQRGLGGIEQALFGETALDPQSCSYLVAASQLVADASTAVYDGWTVGIDGAQSFADQLTDPGQGGMYATEHEALGDLINSMIFAIADVADARIGRASGDVTGTPVPEQIDAGRAHRAKQDAIDVVAGVQALFAGAADSAGVVDIVTTISEPTATAMNDELAGVLTDLAALNDPLIAATDPAPAHAAYEALKVAQVTLRAEIASQLGVTLTFGDADGDS